MSNPFDKESWTEQKKEIINAGGWQCSFCGSINAAYVTSCACGHNQDDSYENLHGRYVPRPDEEYTEQQPAGESVAESSALTATESSVASSLEESSAVPGAEAFSSFEGMPVAFEEPSEAASVPFEETADVVTEAESPFEEIPSAPISAVDTVTEEEATVPEFAGVETGDPLPAEEPVSEDIVTAAPEPAPAAPPVKKPVSKTNKPIEEYTEYEQGILNNGGWECAFCGSINASYVTSCSCGHSEDDSFLKRRGKYTGPDAEETETSTGAPATETATSVTSTPATPAASAAELTPADMIAEIEQELAADSSEMAKFRAIRKYKNLVKRGYMTKEEFNKKQDELLNFEEEDAMAAPESSGEDDA